MENCIFCKIIERKIPANILYEDDDVIAFHDIRPIARVHFLLIPKKHIISLADASAADQALLGKMLLLAAQLAKEQGLDDGFKTSINTGVGGGQEVFHLHLHVYGDGR